MDVSDDEFIENFDFAKLTATQFCFAFNINQTSRKISRFYDELLSVIGITNNQFTLLSLIGILKKPSIKNLAEMLTTEHSTMSRNIKNLEKEGFIEFIMDPEDKRSKLIELSKNGKIIIIRGFEIWNKTNDALLKEFGKNPIEFLSELRDIRKSIDKLD